jgi:hypothetical protein
MATSGLYGYIASFFRTIPASSGLAIRTVQMIDPVDGVLKDVQVFALGDAVNPVLFGRIDPTGSLNTLPTGPMLDTLKRIELELRCLRTIVASEVQSALTPEMLDEENLG